MIRLFVAIAKILECFGCKMIARRGGDLAVVDSAGELIIRSIDMFVDTEDGMVVVVPWADGSKFKGGAREIAGALLTLYLNMSSESRFIGNRDIAFEDGIIVCRRSGLKYSYPDRQVLGWPDGEYPFAYLSLYSELLKIGYTKMPKSLLEFVSNNMKIENSGYGKLRFNCSDASHYIEVPISPSLENVKFTLKYTKDEVNAVMYNKVIDRLGFDTPLDEVWQHTIRSDVFKRIVSDILMERMRQNV